MNIKIVNTQILKSRILSVIPRTRQEPTKGARTRAVTRLYTVNVKCSNFLLMLGRVFRFSEVCISIGQVLEHVEQSTQPRHYRYLLWPDPCHALLTSSRGWNTMILFRSYELRRFLGIIIDKYYKNRHCMQFHSQIRYFWNLSFRKVW